MPKTMSLRFSSKRRGTKIIFLIAKPKHMLWVLKRTIPYSGMVLFSILITCLNLWTKKMFAKTFAYLEILSFRYYFMTKVCVCLILSSCRYYFIIHDYKYLNFLMTRVLCTSLLYKWYTRDCKQKCINI